MVVRVWSLLLILAVLGGCDRPPIERLSGVSNPTTDVAGFEARNSDDTIRRPGGFCSDAPFLSAQTLTTDPRVEILLSGLSLADKVDQMAGFKAGAEMFATPNNENAGIRGFKFRDGPRGVRLESGTATCFPVPVARGATWDLDVERRVGEAIAAETRGLGHNCLLAPTINTLRHPGWGRGQETYGEDPWFLGRMGIASVLGIQEHVPACVKHFAGNNIEDTRMTNNAVIDEQTLRENYTRQFEMVVEESDVACVMAAYNKVNGHYCCENKPLLRTLLKEEWKFDGFVVSDWFAAIHTVESALGGLDVEMPFRYLYEGLQLAVGSGQVPEELVDDAVERILRIKFKFGFGLLAEAYDGDPDVVESKEHIALAREAAQKAMVLLKNEGDVLPLNRASIQRLAVIGKWATEPRLGDAGSSNVTPSYAVTPYLGIKAAAGDSVEVVTSPDSSAAADADVAVVIVALTQQDEGEAWNGGGDRDSLDLSADQEKLVVDVAKVAPVTIVVIEAGGPITMEAWKQSADGIVMAWYPGMEGGRAIADVLFGDVNFSGRLVQTWPKEWDDEPLFGNHQDETEFEFLHGYRHFDEKDIEPLFPFGFGLSYTTFLFSNLVVPCEVATTAAQFSVQVDVENTGEVSGVAVPQLYVSYPDTAQRRPPKELKGFARVELKAGEKKTVDIPLRIRDLAYFDVEKHAWVVEETEHLIQVGPDALELPLSANFLVGGQGVER
jgi:beta-glucosidase